MQWWVSFFCNSFFIWILMEFAFLLAVFEWRTPAGFQELIRGFLCFVQNHCSSSRTSNRDPIQSGTMHHLKGQINFQLKLASAIFSGVFSDLRTTHYGVLISLWVVTEAAMQRSRQGWGPLKDTVSLGMSLCHRFLGRNKKARILVKKPQKNREPL